RAFPCGGATAFARKRAQTTALFPPRLPARAPRPPPPGLAGDQRRRLCLLRHRARLSEGPPRPWQRGGFRRDTRGPAGRDALVSERRRPRPVARDRARPGRGRGGPPGARAGPAGKPAASLLLLLPR